MKTPAHLILAGTLAHNGVMQAMSRAGLTRVVTHQATGISLGDMDGPA